MATVPFQPLQQVAPSVPMEAQSVPAATPDAFGAQEGVAQQQLGQNISQLGQHLMASQLRLQSREDAIERARDYGRFDQAAQDKLIKLSTEDDLSKQSTVNAYRQFIDEQKNKIVGEHRGSPDSQLQLMNRLEEDRIRLVGQAATMSVKAQNDMMQRNIGGTLNQLTASAFENPASVPTLFQQLDRSLQDLGPALTPEQQALHRDGGRAKIAGTAIESFVARGDFDAAETVLSMPGVAEVIGTEAQNKMRGVILESKLELRKARTAGISKGTAAREELRAFLGREPTDLEVATKANIVPKEGQGGGIFGSGLTGRALSILTEGAPLYAQGMLTAQQDAIFESALTQYQQPTWAPNPDTGVMELRRPELPPQVREAARRRGINVPAAAPSVGGQAPSLLGEPVGRTDRGEPIYEAPNDAAALRMMQEVNRAGGKAVVRVAGADGKPQAKVWDMASDISGPSAVARSTIGGMPIVGDIFPNAKAIQAQSYWNVLAKDLVRSLQNSPNYAQGERKAIEDMLNVEPKFFEAGGNFPNKLVGIDKGLAEKEKNAYETARSPNVSLQERKHAMDVFNSIVKFRDSLGVPPQYSPQEFKKLKESGVLKKGDKFLDTEGKQRTVE